MHRYEEEIALKRHLLTHERDKVLQIKPQVLSGHRHTRFGVCVCVCVCVCVYVYVCVYAPQSVCI
jgi:hypothetical protein